MINFDSFERLYRTLRLRRDVAEIFLEFAHNSLLSFDEFWMFLVEVQMTEWSIEQGRLYYEKFSSGSEKGMDLDHFSALYIPFI